MYRIISPPPVLNDITRFIAFSALYLIISANFWSMLRVDTSISSICVDWYNLQYFIFNLNFHRNNICVDYIIDLPIIDLVFKDCFFYKLFEYLLEIQDLWNLHSFIRYAESGKFKIIGIFLERTYFSYKNQLSEQINYMLVSLGILVRFGLFF